MRLDRTLTLALGRPLAGLGMASDAAVPVLMYHRITDEPETAAPYYRLNTSPAGFERQMVLLNELGFRSVSLDAVLERPARKDRASKEVVITFDDGFRDFYDVAHPILRKHGHVATVYLPTSYIGNERRTFKNTECLTWREVRELRKAGVHFGSHTVNHPKLFQLAWKEIEVELAGSKERIEQELGEHCSNFAYPYAFPREDRTFTKTFSEILRAQGYRTCATTAVGRVRAGDDPYCIKRLPVNDCDDRVLLEAKLKGAYDWLGVPQHCSRLVRHWTKRPPRRAAHAHALPNGLHTDNRAQKSTL